MTIKVQIFINGELQYSVSMDESLVDDFIIERFEALRKKGNISFRTNQLHD